MWIVCNRHSPVWIKVHRGFQGDTLNGSLKLQAPQASVKKSSASPKASGESCAAQDASKN